MRHSTTRSALALALLGLVASLPACAGDGTSGSGDPPTSSGPAPDDPATTSTTLATLGVAGAASVGLVLDGSCPQPWRPVYAGGSVYGAEEPADWPDEVPPSRDISLDPVTPGSTSPDTDGDGRTDVIGTTAEGAAILIERGDGQVVLAVPGVVGFPGGRASEGDLDGDGRDDLVVYVSPFTDPPRAEDVVVVVPGSVAPGTHDPREVGVELFASSAPAGVVSGVGDQDGDGADDVAWSGEIVPGPALLAPGPGGRVTTRPTLGAFPEGTASLVSLAPEVGPVAVSLAAGPTPGTAELTVHVEPLLVLITDRLPWPASEATPGSVAGWSSGGDRYVWLTVDGGRSGTRHEWAWNLDDPCAGPAAP